MSAYTVDEMEQELQVPDAVLCEAASEFDAGWFATDYRKNWPLVLLAICSPLPIFLGRIWAIVPMLAACWAMARAAILNHSRDSFLDGVSFGYQLRVRREMEIPDEIMPFVKERRQARRLNEILESEARKKSEK
jgi:hypothetical protein